MTIPSVGVFVKTANLDLMPCDILAFRGNTWLSRVILWASKHRGEDSAKASHVGFVIVGGPFLDATIQEAVNKVRRTTLRSSYLGSKYAIAVFRPTSFNPGDAKVILQAADFSLGKVYGYFNLVLQLLDSFLGDAYVFRRFSSARHPICSENLSRCWEAAGYSFGVEALEATPNDVVDFCMSHPEHYQLIWGFQSLDDSVIFNG